MSLWVLSQAHGQGEANSGFVRENHVNELKRGLVQIKQELETLEPNNERPAVAPPLSSTNPKTGSKTVSQPPVIFKRTAAISEVKEDLRLIRQGLLELQEEETTEPHKLEPSPETSVPVRRVVKVRQRNNYFLFVNPGIVFAQDREYTEFSGGKTILETHNGLDLSITFGGKFDSWSIGPEIGFRRIGYKHAILSTSPIPFNATGDSTSYSFALYGGRDFSIGHHWNLHAALSLGVASRHETFTIHDPALSFKKSDDGPRFQGSIRMAIEYAFSNLCAAHIGYRFTYVDDLRDFDSMPIHQAELGLRLNL